MNYYDEAKEHAIPLFANQQTQEQEQTEQRRREIHQRLERLNEERRLKRQLSDEWDD